MGNSSCFFLSYAWSAIATAMPVERVYSFLAFDEQAKHDATVLFDPNEVGEGGFLTRFGKALRGDCSRRNRSNDRARSNASQTTWLYDDEGFPIGDDCASGGHDRSSAHKDTLPGNDSPRDLAMEPILATTQKRKINAKATRATNNNHKAKAPRKATHEKTPSAN